MPELLSTWEKDLAREKQAQLVHEQEMAKAEIQRQKVIEEGKTARTRARMNLLGPTLTGLAVLTFLLAVTIAIWHGTTQSDRRHNEIVDCVQSTSNTDPFREAKLRGCFQIGEE